MSRPLRVVTDDVPTVLPALQNALAGGDAYLDRVEVLVAEMLKDDGVRLPGARREALRRKAEGEGIEVAEAVLASLRES